MNAEEATIHGLLEGIERTSLSKFLADIFLKNKKDYLRVVNPLTLPPNISDVVNRLEKEISSKIFVLVMSRINCNTVLRRGFPQVFDSRVFCEDVR